MTDQTLTALDLFAGTGWGVACQRLGIRESGVEIMPEAVASRTAAGMPTVYNDVWDGLEARRSPAAEAALTDWLSAGGDTDEFRTILIASPPCQTFSVAGKGAGRKALDDVLGLIPVAVDPDADLRAVAAEAGLDDRTALVLTPLAYVARFMPTYIALEQVPTVKPVWEAVAAALRTLGYSAAVGVLNAEQYGVPQTRKRAILIARRDGKDAALPTPTHSRYYSRDPQRLDPGVQKWVSMAEALGWGMTERPMVTLGNAAGRAEGVGGSGAKAAIYRELDAGRWKPRGLADRPSPTITGGGTATGGAEPIAKFSRYTALPAWQGASKRLEDFEAAVLQTYPPDFPFQGNKGKRFLQIGNAVPPLLAQAILATFLD